MLCCINHRVASSEEMGIATLRMGRQKRSLWILAGEEEEEERREKSCCYCTLKSLPPSFSSSSLVWGLGLGLILYRPASFFAFVICFPSFV